MSKPNGGPAFPPSWRSAPKDGLGGMSLRDYFAGQALTGILAWSTGTRCNSPQWAACMSYQLADAMIEERDK